MFIEVMKFKSALRGWEGLMDGVHRQGREVLKQQNRNYRLGNSGMCRMVDQT